MSTLQKIVLAFIAMVVLGASSLSGAVIGVWSFAAYSFEGSKAGQWDILYDSNNVTYNAQADYYITNATYEGKGYTQTLVIAESLSDITTVPIVGASTVDAELVHTYDTTVYGYPARAFVHFHDAHMVGNFVSIYPLQYTNASDLNKFLRFP